MGPVLHRPDHMLCRGGVFYIAFFQEPDGFIIGGNGLCTVCKTVVRNIVFDLFLDRELGIFRLLPSRISDNSLL